MIVVAICGEVVLCDADAASCITRCAEQASPSVPISIERFDNPLELVERISSGANNVLVDLVVCGEGLKGMTTIEMLRDLRAGHGDGKTHSVGLRALAAPRFVLAQRDAEHALEASRLEAEEYLVTPATCEAFEMRVKRCLREIAREHGDSAVMRCRSGWQRVLLGHVVYAQTSNHDQMLRLDDGTTQVTRATSKELFDKMSQGESRFFKAGSSYIVNLAHIRSVRASGNVVTFDDGSAISVPSRSRSALEAELLARYHG